MAFSMSLTASSAALSRLAPSLPAACTWHACWWGGPSAHGTSAGHKEARPAPRGAMHTAPPTASASPAPEPGLCSFSGPSHRRCLSLSNSFVGSGAGAATRQATKQAATVRAATGQAAGPSLQQMEHQESLLGSLFDAQLGQYLAANPTSSRCLELVQHWEHGAPLAFDHLAFRTFGADGYGIESIGALLEAFGYTRRDSLAFPRKKLRALWFSPPPFPDLAPGPRGGEGEGERLRGAAPSLPRVFVSELAVEEMSAGAQDIIRRYTGEARSAAPHAFALSPLCPRPWKTPSSRHFQTLARESEYAAWTLVNGFSLNHTTISVHRLGFLADAGKEAQAVGFLADAGKEAQAVGFLADAGKATASAEEGSPGSSPLRFLNSRLEAKGIKLNQQGGKVKVSPDGLLLQSSTVADSATFDFSDGTTLPVPVSYIEFALRLVLPQFAHLPPSKIEEEHRRDGFEVGNADKIFESTSSTQAS